MISPNHRRLVFELGHSQAHKRYAENEYAIKSFNLDPGGAILFVRDTIVGNDSLGKNEHDQTFSLDSVIMHKHLPVDPAPKESESMPKHDTIENLKIHNRSIKDLRNDLKGMNLSTKGNITDMRDRCNKSNPPIKTKEKIGKTIKGHVGMRFGLMDAFWHRWHIDPNAINLPTCLEVRNIARSMSDSTNEPSEIEMSMKRLCIEVVFTPKGHCELAE